MTCCSCRRVVGLVREYLIKDGDMTCEADMPWVGIQIGPAGIGDRGLRTGASWHSVLRGTTTRHELISIYSKIDQIMMRVTGKGDFLGVAVKRRLDASS